MAFETTPGRVISMLEMFQKSKRLRQTQIHAAKMVRFLFDNPFCGLCIQSVDMSAEGDLAGVYLFRMLRQIHKSEALVPCLLAGCWWRRFEPSSFDVS
jgi:hypothetical protein